MLRGMAALFGLLVLAIAMESASAECPGKYKNASSTHTMCKTDKGEEIVLDDATKKAVVDLHNEYRADVTPPAMDMHKLMWDDRLAMVATKWAMQCVLGHDKYRDRKEPDLVTKIGQNFAAGHTDILSAIRSWADEITKFTYGVRPNDGDVVEHYTQIIYADTKLVGCGAATCNNSPYKNHYVCNYAQGQFTSTTPYKICIGSCEKLIDCQVQTCDLYEKKKKKTSK